VEICLWRCAMVFSLVGGLRASHISYLWPKPSVLRPCVALLSRALSRVKQEIPRLSPNAPSSSPTWSTWCACVELASTFHRSIGCIFI
jgi:hypothetical protein